MPPLVLGVDPGFATFGWAVAEVRSDRLEPKAMGVFITVKADRKQQVYSADDNLHRLYLLHAQAMDAWAPYLPRVLACCAETMSFPRQSQVAAKMAMAWGMLATVMKVQDIPIYSVTPQQLKLKVFGAKTATKGDMMAAMDTLFERDLVVDFLGGLRAGLYEHPYDALAAIKALEDCDGIKALRRSVRVPR